MKSTIQSSLIKLSLFLILFVAGASQASAIDMVAYHANTGTDHTTQTKQLIGQGYRLITLSVYGNPADPRIAAVWIKRSGPEWKWIYGYAPNDYVKFHADMVKQNFYPALISVVGSGAAARYSGTFEKAPATEPGKPIAIDLPTSEVPGFILQMRKEGFMPRTVSIYGDASQPRYAITWQRASSQLAWDAEGVDEDGNVYQQRYEAQIAQWGRPAFVTVSPFGRYCSVFRDDQIGSFVARHNQTSQDYQNEFTKWTAEGFYPACVQAGGVGANLRFAAIFVKQETPAARTMSPPRGKAVPALAEFDNQMMATLKKSKARAASLAIAKDGRLVFARAYTWAEPGYPVTEPTSTFRIASCSKPITSIAIFQLMDKKLIKFFTSVKDLQNFPALPKSQSIPNTFQQVTVDLLLNHHTGWGDVQQDDAASQLFNTPLPISKYTLAAYNFSQGVPTKAYNYSNFAYSVLGLLIEKMSGMKYDQYVKTNIFAPLGIGHARIALPLWSQRTGLQVRYHDNLLRARKSRADGSGKLMPLPYGSENLSAFDSFGGWEIPAAEYARILAELSKKDKCILLKENYNMMFSRPPTGYYNPNGKGDTGYGWGWWFQPLGNTPFGTTVTSYSHGGALPGVSTWICHRTDGIDIVAFYNGERQTPDLNAIANSIPAANWPTNDLFPEMGMK